MVYYMLYMTLWHLFQFMYTAVVESKLKDIRICRLLIYDRVRIVEQDGRIG